MPRLPLWKNMLTRFRYAVGPRVWKRYVLPMRLEVLEDRTLLAGSSTQVLSTSLPTVVNTAGSALSFNGTNNYLITPEMHSAFPNNSETIELWFKANSPGVLVDELGQPTLNTAWHDSQIEILSSGQVSARVWNLPSVNLGTASFGAWHFVALRYNSSTSTLDGVLDGTPSATTVTGTAQRSEQRQHLGADLGVLRIRRDRQWEPGQRRLVQRLHRRRQHLERRPLDLGHPGRHDPAADRAPDRPGGGLPAQ